MPVELRIGLQCERWGALPYGGGLLEQPLGLMNQMTEALTAYRLCQQRQSKSATDWAKDNPAAARFFFEVDEMRELARQSDLADPA